MTNQEGVRKILENMAGLAYKEALMERVDDLDNLISQAEQEILGMIPKKKTFKNIKSDRTALRRHGYNEAINDITQRMRGGVNDPTADIEFAMLNNIGKEIESIPKKKKYTKTGIKNRKGRNGK